MLFFIYLVGLDDEGLVSVGRAQGSPSFMKQVFGAGWGKRVPGAPGQGQPVDPRYQITPELLDPLGTLGLGSARKVGKFFCSKLCLGNYRLSKEFSNS